MKIQNVKTFLKNKSLETIDERLTQDFIDYLRFISSNSILYTQTEPTSEFFITKLRVKFIVGKEFPLDEIYDELLTLCLTKNLKAIIVYKLLVTPEVIDAESTEKYRGIMVFIKYVPI